MTVKKSQSEFYITRADLEEPTKGKLAPLLQLLEEKWVKQRTADRVFPKPLYPQQWEDIEMERRSETRCGTLYIATPGAYHTTARLNLRTRLGDFPVEEGTGSREPTMREGIDVTVADLGDWQGSILAPFLAALRCGVMNEPQELRRLWWRSHNPGGETGRRALQILRDRPRPKGRIGTVSIINRQFAAAEWTEVHFSFPCSLPGFPGHARFSVPPAKNPVPREATMKETQGPAYPTTTTEPAPAWSASVGAYLQAWSPWGHRGSEFVSQHPSGWEAAFPLYPLRVNGRGILTMRRTLNPTTPRLQHLGRKTVVTVQVDFTESAESNNSARHLLGQELEAFFRSVVDQHGPEWVAAVAEECRREHQKPTLAEAKKPAQGQPPEPGKDPQPAPKFVATPGAEYIQTRRRVPPAEYAWMRPGAWAIWHGQRVGIERIPYECLVTSEPMHVDLTAPLPWVVDLRIPGTAHTSSYVKEHISCKEVAPTPPVTQDPPTPVATKLPGILQLQPLPLFKAQRVFYQHLRQAMPHISSSDLATALGQATGMEKGLGTRMLSGSGRIVVIRPPASGFVFFLDRVARVLVVGEDPTTDPDKDVRAALEDSKDVLQAPYPLVHEPTTTVPVKFFTKSPAEILAVAETLRKVRKG